MFSSPPTRVHERVERFSAGERRNGRGGRGQVRDAGRRIIVACAGRAKPEPDRRRADRRVGIEHVGSAARQRAHRLVHRRTAPAARTSNDRCGDEHRGRATPLAKLHAGSGEIFGGRREGFSARFGSSAAGRSACASGAALRLRRRASRS